MKIFLLQMIKSFMVYSSIPLKINVSDNFSSHHLKFYLSLFALTSVSFLDLCMIELKLRILSLLIHLEEMINNFLRNVYPLFFIF
jgi:hypothetical protein